MLVLVHACEHEGGRIAAHRLARIRRCPEQRFQPLQLAARHLVDDLPRHGLEPVIERLGVARVEGGIAPEAGLALLPKGSGVLPSLVS